MNDTHAGIVGGQIEAWSPTHTRWSELSRIVANAGQASWVAFRADWHQSDHMVVALDAARIVGFLRFVVQPIGAEEDHELAMLDGVVLTEAKILAFGVVENQRGKGWGRALQTAALERARALGCYQVRSWSDGAHDANHRLKLRLGFGVYPQVRGDDRKGVYFIMPLVAPADR